MGVRPFFFYEIASRAESANDAGQREHETPSRFRRVVDMAVRARRSPESSGPNEHAASYVHDCNFLD